ncbi:hypothetical protein EJB05_42448 [Eragrostis curvula]|uniref:Knottin scorpion toxin-like domain-containing protein n=1 Tax=Eragrostis curvula TaxID=38414 RepID=A0A5J9TEH6_9POAL|nr:hypothetical protein EJB05_42448 [Eragrostis curvula]
MARVGGAVVAIFVLAFLFVSAAASTPQCCNVGEHQWGPPHQKPGCAIPEQNESCNKWCQPTCRGGECKIRGGKHVCHCYC